MFMKIKKVLVITLLLATIVMLAGCDFTVFANTLDPTQPTEQATEPVTEPKKCKLQIQSYDKQNLTDEILYYVGSVNENGETKEIIATLTTTNGLAHIDLAAGDYVLSTDISDFREKFTIEENETSKVIEAENNKMYNVLSNATGVCVVGDSITIGSVSGGYGWYDGLIERFPNIKTVDVAASGGQTSESIFENKTDVEAIKKSTADTYIIALGINDVVFRDKNGNSTTFTTAEYIKNIEDLVEYINTKDETKQNQFIFVAPFEYSNKKSFYMTKYIKQENTHQEYTLALSNWCNMHRYAFIAPMTYVKNTLATVDDPSEYIIDDVHPAYPLGTQLYSKAVYESSVVSRKGTLRISQVFYKEVQRKPKDYKYKEYPIDYQKTEVSKDVITKSRFSIKCHVTGMYIELKENSEGKLEYKRTTTEPHYYYPDEDGYITIYNLPNEGGYIVNFQDNSLGYTSYLDTEIIYVNAGNIITNAYIHMKYDK